MKKQILLFILFFVLTKFLLAQPEKFTSEEKPWLWWYWLGSAVSESGINSHLVKFNTMGYGGASIAATYGVKGFEDKEISFMSRKWIDKINFTAQRAKEMNMGIDVSLTSAWPFGGPNVTAKMAARYSTGGKLFSVSGDYMVIKEVYNPGIRNLEAISAFSDKGSYLNLLQYVSPFGLLKYSFPKGNWEVYGLFSAPTSQKTKRSGEGGEGLVLDHFDKSSVQEYLKRYDSLFIQKNYIRSTFNDSYEVYGADYTPLFLEEFRKRRGYRLQENLNHLFSAEKTETYHRILCDYRETISDLLLEKFLEVWSNWAKTHNVKTVEQAHGAPGNLLDLYGAADIPQTESFGASVLGIPGVRIDQDYNEKVFGRPDKLVLKFASSASNVEGKKLTSSESATWLGNHFKVALSQVKPQIDELFLSGVNHIMLTCTAYSPDSVEFPGWRFYPGSNFGPTSAFADYMTDFSKYISRSQKLLQNSKPDNEVLLYMPVHDLWSECEDDDERSKLKMFTVHSTQSWLYKFDFGVIARNLRSEGFDFDYISDRQILKLSISGGQILTSGGTHYKTIVIPNCKRIPIKTLTTLHDLAKAGVNIVFAFKMPTDIPGLVDVENRHLELSKITGEMRTMNSVHVTSDYTKVLESLNLQKESFEENHLNYIRKKNGEGIFYFVANQSNLFHEGWVELGKEFRSACIYDPETGMKGIASTKGKRVYLQLEPGESCFIELYNERTEDQWSYFKETQSFRIDGVWNISFIKGAPVLPASYRSKGLDSWVFAPDTMAKYFSGVGRYEIVIDIPSQMVGKSKYKLNLGEVREIADVWINEVYVGRTWSVPFEIDVDPKLLRAKGNILRVEIRNLDANRIIWMDRNKVPWQKFFFVDVTYDDFNAAGWNPVPSGLIGPVKLLSSE